MLVATLFGLVFAFTDMIVIFVFCLNSRARS